MTLRQWSDGFRGLSALGGTPNLRLDVGEAMTERSQQGSRGRKRRRLAVRDINGTRLGWVEEHALSDDYVTIELGFLYPTDVAVPRSWVTHVSESYVQIGKTKREVESERRLQEMDGYEPSSGKVGRI